MALRRLDGTLQLAFNDATRQLHYVSVAADQTVTDLGAVVTLSGADVDIGDVHLLNTATPAAKISPATETTLALVKAKTDNIPAQGQALAAASLPVVLPAAQITTLTPPAAITGFALEASMAALLALVRGTNLLTAVITAPAGATTQLIAAPGANKQLWIYSGLITASAGGSATVFKSGATALTGSLSIGVNGPLPIPFMKCATNEAFNVTTVTAVLGGIVAYEIVNV